LTYQLAQALNVIVSITVQQIDENEQKHNRRRQNQKHHEIVEPEVQG
jgi:hypothetical protein